MRFRRDPAQLLSRQLQRVRAELGRAWEDLAVAEEQFLVVDADVDDAEVRKVLDETVASARQHTAAVRHAELMARQLDQARARVVELEAAETAIVAGLGE